MKCYAVFAKNPSKAMIGARAIEFAENINFSHAAIFLEDQFGFVNVYESVWPKSRKIKLNKWLRKYKIIYIYSFPIRDHYEFLEMSFFLNSKTNIMYSVFQLFVIFLSFFSPIEKLISGRVVNGSKRLICTELVGDFFERFFQCKWNEPTDTISLTETRNEILKKWNEYANISDS